VNEESIVSDVSIVLVLDVRAFNYQFVLTENDLEPSYEYGVISNLMTPTFENSFPSITVLYGNSQWYFCCQWFHSTKIILFGNYVCINKINFVFDLDFLVIYELVIMDSYDWTQINGIWLYSVFKQVLDYEL
jgi:hypothetical protein